MKISDKTHRENLAKLRLLPTNGNQGTDTIMLYADPSFWGGAQTLRMHERKKTLPS